VIVSISSVKSRLLALRGYAILLVLVVLAGCGATTTAAPSPSTAQTPSTARTSSAARTPGTATRTVVDMAGRTVTLPAQVTRIGTNYPAVNQILFMLGATNRLVATSQGTAAEFPFFVSLYPRLKDIPTPFGTSPTDVNLEALLATRPNVVFVSSNSSMAAKLQSAGIPVVVLAVFNSPADIEAGVKLVADVLGGDAPARAQRFSQYYNANIAQATSKTVNIPMADRPKVYYTAGNPLQTEGKGSIVVTWINEGGGQDIAAENGVTGSPFATINLETLLRWNPDFIICRDPATRQQILQDPRFRSIAAVRNNHVIIDPQGVFVWSVRSGESALQPLWAAKTFHPHLFANFNMRTEVRTFYQTFYSYKLSNQQVNEILNPTQS
jgi:iron complex transport system substrate-binding protein